MSTIAKALGGAAPAAAHRLRSAQAHRLMAAGARAMCRIAVAATDRISETCRLVRAYNDLSRLDAATLRAIGAQEGELDRILSGGRPRKGRGRRTE
ncbi:MAG: hypothetical protein R3229_05065 [Alphaproteobacteria bacterium]|nr:hypothetical protein [Alphaproteobacteria bacterium]